jgi:hypothetical protein
MKESELDRIVSEERPGTFELWGIRYFQNLSRKHRAYASSDIEGLDRFARSDEDMVLRVNRITLIGSLIAFLIGAVSAGGSVLAEIMTEGESAVVHYAWIGGVTAILTLIEFSVLFIVSIRTVFGIARITGHDRLEANSDILAGMIPNLLSRAALEIPDPVRKIFGIDPLARVSRKRLLFVGILYKAKIILSNVLAKLILKRILAKSGVRIVASWVSVPITGIWNAVVTIKVAREARLRLFGNLLAEHIARDLLTERLRRRLSPEAKLGCLQAIGNSVVLTQNYHPNMLILIVRIAKVLKIREGKQFEQWELFLETLSKVTEGERFFLLDLLAVSTAFDGHLSSLERRLLPEAFGEHTEIYMDRIGRLIRLLHAGRLNDAKRLCGLDFQAG